MNKEKREYKMVGKSVPRKDAVPKVRGKAQFTDDIVLPGMVYGKIKPSTIAHGWIKEIDCSQVFSLPGVLDVITGKDTPVPFSVNNHLPTETPLAVEKVRYFGEGIAAVAALDEETAEEAIDLIQVKYEPILPLFDPIESMEQNDIRIHDFAKNNINVEGEQHFGDVDDAMSRAPVIVEDIFKSSYVNGAFIEPQSAIADYNSETKKLTLYTCTQLPHYMQGTISRALNMPMERVRIIVPFVGGGFGGKTEATPAALVACILSQRLSRPVKITYDRPEVFFQNKGRHPALMKVKMGFEKDGKIIALDFDTTLDGGAHSSWGLVVLWFSAALIQLPYKIPNIRFRGRRVYTNKPTCGAQRGLAGVQVRMAIESLLDEAAEQLGISPYEIRIINAVETGYQTKSTVYVGHSEYKKCLQSVVEKSGYLQKHKKLPYGRGIGLAGAHYSSGGAFLLYRSFRPHSTANIRVDTEAGVTIFVGATDIGQGSTTVLSQMAAEILGLDYKDINVVCQDTLLAPMDNGTYDSRVTFGAGHAVKRAALEVKKKLFEATAIELGVRPEHLECRDGQIFSIYDPRKKIGFYEAVAKYQNSWGTLFGVGEYTPPQPQGNYPGKLIGPSPAFGFTAQVAEVEVDLETGKIKILNYYEAGDCGQPINPMSVEGQVHGGISMGIGQALYEEMVVGEDGRIVNSNFHDYKIPTSMDMPEIITESVESYDPNAPFGNKETGEGPTCAVIPAILNAIYDAIGIRIKEVPVTPEKILRALGKIK
ncbi:MAG: xanthine dehydrogenase family protein molybdopterin-binding subunit [Candidatus Anstonellales archaeon]